MNNPTERTMTGPEHYREAERLIAPGEYDEDGDARLLPRDIALAQVHATLALAAATAEAGGLILFGDVTNKPATEWARTLGGAL